MSYRTFVALLWLTTLCTLTSAQGISRTEIVLGQTADFSGPQAALVKETTAAAKAYFDKINSQGGVAGRKIVLTSLDDGYDVKRTVENATKLIDEKQVFALMLPRGTANAEALLPILTDRRVPLLGPVGGSKALHEPPNRYLFNIRPQYRTEAERIVGQLTAQGITKIGIVYTDDAFGKDALQGAIDGLKTRKLEPTGLVSIERGSVNVDAAVKLIGKGEPSAIIGLCIAKPCVALVKGLRKAGIMSTFVSLSNTSAPSYISDLGDDSRGVMVSQVFPFPESTVIAVSREFGQLADAAKLPKNYSSMEGFIAAKIMVEAIKRAGKDPTRESMVAALESFKQLDLGGFVIGFGPKDRTGNDFVELTMVGKHGKFIR